MILHSIPAGAPCAPPVTGLMEDRAVDGSGAVFAELLQAGLASDAPADEASTTKGTDDPSVAKSIPVPIAVPMVMSDLPREDRAAKTVDAGPVLEAGNRLSSLTGATQQMAAAETADMESLQASGKDFPTNGRLASISWVDGALNSSMSAPVAPDRGDVRRPTELTASAAIGVDTAPTAGVVSYAQPSASNPTSVDAGTAAKPEPSSGSSKDWASMSEAPAPNRWEVKDTVSQDRSLPDQLSMQGQASEKLVQGEHSDRDQGLAGLRSVSASEVRGSNSTAGDGRSVPPQQVTQPAGPHVTGPQYSQVSVVTAPESRSETMPHAEGQLPEAPEGAAGALRTPGTTISGAGVPRAFATAVGSDAGSNAGFADEGEDSPDGGLTSDAVGMATVLPDTSEDRKQASDLAGAAATTIPSAANKGTTGAAGSVLQSLVTGLPAMTAPAGEIARQAYARAEQLHVAAPPVTTGASHEVSLRVDAGKLGTVDVTVRNTDGSASIVLTAPSQAGADLLRRDAGDLQRSLSDAGVRSDGVRVETRGDGQRSSSGHGQRSDDRDSRDFGGEGKRRQESRRRSPGLDVVA